MITIGFGFIIGTVIGSLVLCLAMRSLTKESFKGRSYCDNCKKQLKWYDLFPILSYLSTSGQCRHCKKKVGCEYLIVEILMGVLVAVLFALTFGLNDLDTFNKLSSQNLYKSIALGLEVLFKIFTISVLVAVAVTDLKSGLIPDRITYPAVIISAIFLLIYAIFRVWVLYDTLQQSPLGRYLLPPHSDYFIRHAIDTSSVFWGSLLTALGLGAFFALLIIFTRGKGMGGGDFKLAIFQGLSLGFPNSLLAILLSFIYGSILSVILIVFGKKKFGQTIPFGPFMSAAGITVIFFGAKILEWYLGIKL